MKLNRRAYTLLALLTIYVLFSPYRCFMLLGIVFIILLKTMHRIELRKVYKRIDKNICLCDAMNGIEFERYLKHIFEKNGYRASVTRASHDYGADLILYYDRDKIVVQAKRYNSKIGIKAVQEVIGAMSYYKADKGIVVTNNYFTQQAKELSHSAGIKLIDRDGLIELTKGIGA